MSLYNGYTTTNGSEDEPISASISGMFNSIVVSEVTYFNALEAADQQRNEPIDKSFVYWAGLCIWTYLIFVVLAPKPHCSCKTSLNGKTVVITGGSDGVGKVTAIELAKLGAKLILPCRNITKGQTVAREIYKETGNKDVTIFYVDFQSLHSVKRCTEEIRKSVSIIDILINNAGIGHGVGATSDGFPQIFGVNHLAPFLFTTRLLDLLRKSSSARIIFVSSVAHLWGAIDFDSLHQLDNGSIQSQFRAYSKSKLANVLFAKQLHRFENTNGITTYVAHPGWTFTGLFRDFPKLLKVFTFPLFHLFLYLPKEGAQTQIHLALAPCLEALSGSYFVSCKESKTCPNALDARLAEDLWSYSEKAVEQVLQRSAQPCPSN